MKRPLKVTLIYGSTRPGRLCDTVARWVAEEVRAHDGFELALLDPLASDFPPNTAALKRRIGESDAAIVVTPEYNHSFPAPLKALIDSVDAEWGQKPVAFVPYGGVSGGLRAVEHLRQVFAELDAHGLRDTVAFAHAWSAFGPDGALASPERSKRAMTTLLDRLEWWGWALKSAREAETVREQAA